MASPSSSSPPCPSPQWVPFSHGSSFQCYSFHQGDNDSSHIHNHNGGNNKNDISSSPSLSSSLFPFCVLKVPISPPPSPNVIPSLRLLPLLYSLSPHLTHSFCPAVPISSLPSCFTSSPPTFSSLLSSSSSSSFPSLSPSLSPSSVPCLLQQDMTSLGVCIELKPKWIFPPSHSFTHFMNYDNHQDNNNNNNNILHALNPIPIPLSIHTVCRYCQHQYSKKKEKEQKNKNKNVPKVNEEKVSVSDYCPLSLLSSLYHSSLSSSSSSSSSFSPLLSPLSSLISSPQNNLKIFSRNISHQIPLAKFKEIQIQIKAQNEKFLNFHNEKLTNRIEIGSVGEMEKDKDKTKILENFFPINANPNHDDSLSSSSSLVHSHNLENTDGISSFHSLISPLSSPLPYDSSPSPSSSSSSIAPTTVSLSTLLLSAPSLLRSLLWLSWYQFNFHGGGIAFAYHADIILKGRNVQSDINDNTLEGERECLRVMRMFEEEKSNGEFPPQWYCEYGTKRSSCGKIIMKHIIQNNEEKKKGEKEGKEEKEMREIIMKEKTDENGDGIDGNHYPQWFLSLFSSSPSLISSPPSASPSSLSSPSHLLSLLPSLPSSSLLLIVYSYLFSQTLKDVSILLSFSPRHSHGSEQEEVIVNIIDLDVKKRSKLLHYMKQQEDIVRETMEGMKEILDKIKEGNCTNYHKTVET